MAYSCLTRSSQRRLVQCVFLLFITLLILIPPDGSACYHGGHLGWITLEKQNGSPGKNLEIEYRRVEAENFLGIARAEQRLGNLARARQITERAIGIVESLRAGIVNLENRASFFASQQEFYQSYLELLMQMHDQNPGAGFDAFALAVNERVRARALLEMLTEAGADIRQGSPRSAVSTQPQPLNAQEIQRQVLDRDTLLIEYALGEQASYLFVVSSDSITSHRLPKRAEIEAETRRVQELLTAPEPRPGETSSERRSRIRSAGAHYWRQAVALSRMLLGPVASQLGTKRLLLVADGVLQYLPFGTLPVPAMNGSGAGTPLIAEHEIVNLPSASTLAVQRRELAGRRPAPKTVAVLADPVFSSDDARVKRPVFAGSAVSPPRPGARGELARLLMTREEAQAILSLAPRDSQLMALDFSANHATSTSAELRQYRIVHFATHGLLNNEQPELSGLVLSLVDEQGRPQNGFLQLQEIFSLRLPAELVVLSACRTGLGKEIKGEGLVGLTRGFMYAGAARVMASLWEVNDAATAELMKRFYRRMLLDGMRPAAALRAAQIEMLTSTQWQSPYYWGAFVLQGEWK